MAAAVRRPSPSSLSLWLQNRINKIRRVPVWYRIWCTITVLLVIVNPIATFLFFKTSFWNRPAPFMLALLGSFLIAIEMDTFPPRHNNRRLLAICFAGQIFTAVVPWLMAMLPQTLNNGHGNGYLGLCILAILSQTLVGMPAMTYGSYDPKLWPNGQLWWD